MTTTPARTNEPSRLPKAPSDSELTLSRIMDNNDTNLMGTVHGGVLLRLVDSVAGVVSARHSEGSSVTVTIDEMVFLVPVRVGDVVHVHARVNWAGTSSMEVGVRVTADRWNRSTPAAHVATAYLVLVGVDDRGRPRHVPPLETATPEDRRRYEEARIRRRHRLARRAAIEDARQQSS